MKIKTAELTGPALDWAVSVAEMDTDGTPIPEYSTSWAKGGPIIENAVIDVLSCDGGDYWQAHIYECDERIEQFGPTPLIAAMRCYVASKLGDEIEIPEELYNA